MEQERKEQVEKIMADMTCEKDFICYKSGFENLCKARDSGMKKYLHCLEEEPCLCEFRLSFGSGHLCSCPLRVYIAKNLNK